MFKSVKLISSTKAATPEITGKNLTEIIAYCARVSAPMNQVNHETDENLIRYLIKNNHWSPFEMVSLCLEVNTTRDIARQILRHRSFSFQEFSQRYAEISALENRFTIRQARLQDHKNRQASIETHDVDLKRKWMAIQDGITQDAFEAYKWAIDNGIAREQARVVLPEGNTNSRLYMSGTLRSWIHYIELRSGNGTQKEHRIIACACAEAIEPEFPMISEFVARDHHD